MISSGIPPGLLVAVLLSLPCVPARAQDDAPDPAEQATERLEAEQEQSSDDVMGLDSAGEVDDLAGDAPDDSALRLTLGLEPLTYATRDRELELAYSLRVDGTPRPWLQYAVRFKQRIDESEDRFTAARVIKRESRLEAGLDVPEIKGRLGLTSYFSLQRSRTGDFFDKRAEIHAGLPGPKLRLDWRRLTKFDLSYVPLVNHLEHDTPNNGPPAIERSLVHRLGLEADLSLIKDKLDFSVTGAYMYLDPIDAGSSDLRDDHVEAESAFKLDLGKGFSATLGYKVDYDSRQRRLFNEPPTQTTARFELAYAISLVKNKGRP